MVRFMPTRFFEISQQLARNKADEISRQNRQMEQLAQSAGDVGGAIAERQRRQAEIEDVRNALDNPDHQPETMVGIQAQQQRVDRRAQVASALAEQDAKWDLEQFKEEGRQTRGAATNASREKIAGQNRADRTIRAFGGGVKDLLQTGMETVGDIFAPKNKPFYTTPEERSSEAYRKAYTAVAGRVDKQMEAEAKDPIFGTIDEKIFGKRNSPQWKQERENRINAELGNMRIPGIGGSAPAGGDSGADPELEKTVQEIMRLTGKTREEVMAELEGE